MPLWSIRRGTGKSSRSESAPKTRRIRSPPPCCFSTCRHMGHFELSCSERARHVRWNTCPHAVTTSGAPSRQIAQSASPSSSTRARRRSAKCPWHNLLVLCRAASQALFVGAAKSMAQRAPRFLWASSVMRMAAVRVLPVPGGPCTSISGRASARLTAWSWELFNFHWLLSVGSIAVVGGRRLRTTSRASRGLTADPSLGGGGFTSASAVCCMLCDRAFWMYSTIRKSPGEVPGSETSSKSSKTTVIERRPSTLLRLSSSSRPSSSPSPRMPAATIRACPDQAARRSLCSAASRMHSQPEASSPPCASRPRNLSLWARASATGTLKLPLCPVPDCLGSQWTYTLHRKRESLLSMAEAAASSSTMPPQRAAYAAADRNWSAGLLCRSELARPRPQRQQAPLSQG
mmetsp:Transcript_2627/g.8451  ORF Transcript_2627/g.8451 Transcript_2627/m.8451 type:complete len:403 (+) Transcript_2627:2417-3625(+)